MSNGISQKMENLIGYSMNDEIEEITPLALPFGMDEKIFQYLDDEGDIIGDAYSLNDWHRMIKNISGLQH